ncbi:MAG TPA: GNAT family N-acetyltransferase [Acidobacteriota bacterium]|jgi:ribosomal-protein-alanine N-acetyltransferase|nr:GNAT family N-acetyltransferase [Acidobacteriota bacterium]
MVQIRHFQDSDFSELLKIDRACFEPGIAYDEVALDYFVRQIYSHTLVLVIDSKIAGFGIAAISRHRARRPTGHIITLDLLERVQGQGHGRSLLRRLEAKLEQDGAAEIVLEVDARNTQAIGFYQKMGYLEKQRLRNYYGTGKDALRMGRLLEGQT